MDDSDSEFSTGDLGPGMTAVFHHMEKKNLASKIAITALFFVGVVACGGCIWLFQSWQESKQSAINAAYWDLLPQTPTTINNRYHEYHVVFTDSVERFRFDGADTKLVEELVQRYELQPA